MAVTRIASATKANNTASTTIVVNKPAGTLQGHLMLCMVAYSNSSILTVLSGWTLLASNVDAFDARSGIYYKIAGASEPSSYTWTFNASDNQVIGITTYSGVDTSNPINANAVSADTGTTQNVTGPSVTTTATSHIVHCRYVRDDRNAVQTITSQAGYGIAFQAEMHISAPVNVVLGMFDQSGTDYAAGTVAGTQLNYNIAGPLGGRSRTIALKSAAPTTTQKSESDTTPSTTDVGTVKAFSASTDLSNGVSENQGVTGTIPSSDTNTSIVDTQALVAYPSTSDTAAGTEAVQLTVQVADEDKGLIEDVAYTPHIHVPTPGIFNSMLGTAQLGSLSLSQAHTVHTKIAITSNDSAVISEESLLTSLSDSTDSGSSVDNGTLYTTLDAIDSGAHTEAQESIALLLDPDLGQILESETTSSVVLDTDTAEINDTASISVTLIDSDLGTGNDELELTTYTSDIDISEGQESAGDLYLSDGDDSSSTDTHNLQSYAVDVDLSSAQDTATILAYTESIDTVALADSETVPYNHTPMAGSFTAMLGSAQLGSLTPSTARKINSTVYVSGSDVSSAEDSQTITVNLPEEDTGSSAEVNLLTVSLTESETDLVLVEDGSIQVDVFNADTSIEEESETLAVAPTSSTDTGTVEEAESIRVVLTSVDDSTFTEIQNLGTQVLSSDANLLITEEARIVAELLNVDTSTSEELGSLGGIGVLDTDDLTLEETEAIEVTLVDLDHISTSEENALVTTLDDSDEAIHLENEWLAFTDYDAADLTELIQLYAEFTDSDATTSIEFEDSKVQLESRDASEFQETGYTEYIAQDSDSSTCSESESIVVYVLNDEGVSAVEVQNLAVAIENLDNSSLTETWLIGLTSEDELTLTLTESESYFEQTAFIDPAALFGVLHLPTVLGNLIVLPENQDVGLHVKYELRSSPIHIGSATSTTWSLKLQTYTPSE